MPDGDSRLDFLSKAADRHLDRAKQLAETEWRVAFAFWTATGAATALGLSRIAAIAQPFLANASWIVLGFEASAIAFLFGFSRNNHISLTTERGRYQFFQNEMAKLLNEPSWIVAAKAGSPPGNRVTKRWAFIESDTWGFKVLTTASLINASFSSIYWTSLVWYDAAHHSDLAPDRFALGLALTMFCCALAIAFSKAVRMRLRWCFDGEARRSDRAALRRRKLMRAGLKLRESHRALARRQKRRRRNAAR